jgi:hypothetical protein
MTRGLSAGQIANLAQKDYRVEYLVELYLESSNNFYYTTGPHSISVTTSTAGAQTFNPQSFIAQVGSITETFQAQPNSLDLQIQRGVYEVHDLLLNYLNNTEINKRLVVYKLFRNTSTAVPDTSNGLIQIFDGSISGMTIDTSLETVTYTLRCTSDFGDFDKIRGRTTGDIAGAMSGKKIFWGSFYLE